MSVRLFTDQQIEQFGANPYTYDVSAKKIIFTKEFKELFWHDYNFGQLTPRQIMQKYNYDIDVLGTCRISGIQQSFKREAELGKGFQDGACLLKTAVKQKETADGQAVDSAVITEMQEKIAYMEQEIEFLKKIFSTANTKRQVPCS